MSTDKRVHVLGRKFAKPCPVLGPICIVAHTFVVLLLSRRVVNRENCYKQKNLKYILLEAWFRVNYKKKKFRVNYKKKKKKWKIKLLCMLI